MDTQEVLSKLKEKIELNELEEMLFDHPHQKNNIFVTNVSNNNNTKQETTNVDLSPRTGHEVHMYISKKEKKHKQHLPEAS